MTERIKHLLKTMNSGDYRNKRNYDKIDITAELEGMSDFQKEANYLKLALSFEHLNIFDKLDRIGFHRTVAKSLKFKNIKGVDAWITNGGNITPNFPLILNSGFDAVRDTVLSKLSACSEEKAEFYNSVLMSIDAVLNFADRCRKEAEIAGATELCNALSRVPHKGATSYYEALVAIKFCIFTLRLARNDHITLGRFDQYMKPYYDMDIKRGVSEDELLELTEEFFISLNIDTDIYTGVQKGDNGQSMVLGGYDLDGNDMYNDLSEICMKASMELCLIDPKINLRVSSKTPISRLEFATEMTKLGLGFPQYSNDDVVVPGLISLGYDPEDAVDYSVAACWEFIIPGKGYEIVNFQTMNFPACVEKVTNETLLSSQTFEEFMDNLKSEIIQSCDLLIENSKFRSHWFGPYFSIFAEGCIENGVNIHHGGAKYKNYGFHGAGISTAADSLAAIKKVIYDEKSISKDELLDALKNDFEGFGELRNKLLSCPKMGNNDDYVDEIACDLMDTYSSYLNGRPNDVGGIFRAGTGSAMEYILSAKNVGATADGRKSGQPYGSSFSPSPNAQLNGPLSVIQSFTKFDLKNIINGGPLTMEVHDTVFRNRDGIKKTAQLVKAFIDLGGHQLQLNAINRDILLDAEAHPENHKNLIVRVWGWSGYFIELDEPYRKHIISRTEHKY